MKMYLGSDDPDTRMLLERKWTNKPLGHLADSLAYPSYTYFAACNGRVKIGRSQQPESRIKSLQTANPEPIKVLCIVPELVMPEEAAHERWAHLRVTGEWFTRTPEIEEWIARLTIRSNEAELVRARLVALFKRQTESWRRPLLQLRAVEARLAQARLKREREEAARKERDQGCRLCGSHDNLRRAQEHRGLFCGPCGAWVQHAVRKGVDVVEQELQEKVRLAQQKLAQHRWRSALYGQYTAEENRCEN